MTNTTRILLTLVIGLGALSPAAALAAGSAVIEQHSAAGDQQSRISWNDAGAVRMQSGGQNGYMIMKNGQLYMVTDIGGQTQVLKLAAMMKMFRSMGKSTETPMAGQTPGSIDQVRPTGHTRKVAGISGHVYKVTTTSQSETRQADWVLSDNGTVREMTAAYLKLASAIVGTDEGKTIASSWKASMPHPEDGVLSMSNGFTLKKISAEAPADGDFALPAKPMDFGSMLKGLGK